MHVSSNRTESAMPQGARGFVPFDRRDVDRSLPALFARQVDRHPHRTAVAHRTHSLTYTELDAQANRVASAILNALGPAHEPVALLLDQGPLTVAAVLGVLKAGKIFVPLDPLDPPDRIAAVAAEVGARLILTSETHRVAARRAAGTERDVLDLGTVDEEPTTPMLAQAVDPNHLAYIFFTSGSTGRPKGVMDTHRNVAHNVMRYTNTLRIGLEDRLSLVQTPSFSGTVSSLFGALLNGAAVCPYDLRQEGADGLAAWVREAEITIYHSVPTLFRVLCRSAPVDEDPFPSVRLIRLEGDRATGTDVELYRRHFSSACVLVNGLGTTETGLCRQYVVDRSHPVVEGVLPVGYPVPDTDALLLNEAGREVEPGQTGEIVVRSRFLSPGYWGQPELTRRAFLPDPEGGEARMYRTGDMGRFRPDGCLEYLGRKDFGLKIRGRRVEPAEVERALLALPFVRDAAALTRADGRGGVSLIAYLVCPPGAAPPEAEIRRLLRERLPQAFVPTGYVFLNGLPVTRNGKVDRRRLPEPDPRAPEPAVRYVQPTTPLERAVAEIWAEVLGRDRVGLDDDFWALGGESMTAMRITHRVNRHVGAAVPYRLLFDHPRLGDLVCAIERVCTDRP